MELDRRLFLGAMAALPFGKTAQAQQLPPSVLALMNHPAAGYFEAPPPGSGVPLNIPITTAHGTGTWMQMFAGKAVLLDLWASWCGPCLVETPGLDALASQYNSRHFSAIALKTADPKTSLHDLSQIFASRQVTALSPMADGSADGWGFFRALKVNTRSSGNTAGLPMAALVGPDGREIARTYGTMTGGKWTNPQIKDFIGQFAEAW
ncbi:hypothetical protein MNBD_ALPHA06-1026 [hydrothermal vent metagenome]|uniref:Thioredoxin domain-containing protein n=1 Tax=hydrothermal vent metagenome TaxID=652676 RepID=A0A3B0RZP1_9ZZZZ